LRRYGEYARFGDYLDFLVEVTIKDDARNDPPITKDALVALRIMTAEEFETCKALTKKAAKLISDELHKKDLNLFDIKFEFGKYNNEILLADDVSAGCMRVYKNGTAVPPMKLGDFILQ
jgi:phosphoribosylaminoimidazole-succinocarboxamide synthase